MRRLVAAPLLALLACAAHAAAPIPLQSGVDHAIAPNASYYIDVDANAQALTVKVDDPSNASQDLDVFVRYGTPFPDLAATDQAVDEELINHYAHYRSLSPLDSETVTITRSGYEPLRAGRWYVAIVRASGGTIRATASTVVPNAGIALDFASASADCDIAPWTDPTPATPVGGNPGATLGAQRRNALQQAAMLMSQQIQTPVPITVRACWKHLGGDAHRATLANAGPTQLLLDDPTFPAKWLPEKYTWYAIAASSHLGGTSSCGLIAFCDADIVATFNTDIGSSTVIGGAPFYYGFAPSADTRAQDFISISMHELTHGLGFLGLVNTDTSNGALGVRFSGQGANGYDQPGFDDAFDRQATIVAADKSTKPFLGATGDAERAAALVSTNGLRWSGSDAVHSALNLLAALAAPDSFPLLYAPCHRDVDTDPCTTEPGSTLSHIAQAGDLMNAFYQRAARTLGLALPMLHAVGWATDAHPAPTYTRPIPTNWYDRTRNGHGIDMQLVARDPALGDLYYVIFYTFDQNAKPVLYFSLGHLVDGVFVGGRNADGRSLYRGRYDAAAHATVPDPAGGGGDVVIDFNGAADSPTCRNASRAGAPALAVMSWTIDGTSGDWCMEPIVTFAQRSTPDFNGQWYGGPSDSGWGLGILAIADGSGPPTLATLVYYPDSQGVLRWASAQTDTLTAGAALPLLQTNGYCRTCASLPLSGRNVGSIALTLTQPTNEGAPSGANRVTLSASFPDTPGAFTRTGAPITLLSLPHAQ